MNDEFRDEYDYENVQRKLMNSMRDEGREDATIEIAKNMLQAGEDIDKIILYTKLTKDEIDLLK